MSKNKVSIIILAAGASRRMGKAKQLLQYKGETLLSYVTKCAIASSASPIVVILGANGDKIKKSLDRLAIEIVNNSEWEEGISSSIRCGVEYIKKKFLHVNGTIFLTCDQPFISTEIMERLIAVYNFSSKPIIASKYGETIGIPALFDRSLFLELMELKGDRGAKKTIQKYRDRVVTIDFPGGEIDLDTPENYRQLLE